MTCSVIDTDTDKKARVRAYKAEWARRKRAEDPKYRERERINGMRSHERHKENRLALSRDWKTRNKEKVKAYRKKYYAANKERERVTTKAWFERNLEVNRAKKHASDRQYRVKNRDRLLAKSRSPEQKAWRNAWQRNRRKTCPKYLIEGRLRGLFRQALKAQKTHKHQRFCRYLGCTVAELKEYLEKKFKPGMTWENRHLWHIDHIRPCASFDLTDFEQQKLCFHYTNLQPLWAKENQQKHRKWPCTT